MHGLRDTLPEPSSIALLAMGAIGLAAMVSRRAAEVAPSVEAEAAGSCH